jgi:hypothetical protein
MAMQIMIGIKKENEIIIDENQRQVNYTETLKEICNIYFEEMNFTEEGEEITYSAIESKSFLEVVQLLCKKQESVINEIKEVRGNEQRNKLIDRLQDYNLMISVLVEASLLSKKNKEVFVVLV